MSWQAGVLFFTLRDGFNLVKITSVFFSSPIKWPALSNVSIDDSKTAVPKANPVKQSKLGRIHCSLNLT